MSCALLPRRPLSHTLIDTIEGVLDPFLELRNALSEASINGLRGGLHLIQTLLRHAQHNDQSHHHQSTLRYQATIILRSSMYLPIIQRRAPSPYHAKQLLIIPSYLDSFIKLSLDLSLQPFQF